MRKPQSQRSLVQFGVTGLFGRFSHEFTLDEGGEFTVLHGPNGVGKTRTLELILAIFERDWIAVQRTPFDCVSVGMSDDSRVSLRKSRTEVRILRRMLERGEVKDSVDLEGFPDDAEALLLAITVDRPEGDSRTWTMVGNISALVSDQSISELSPFGQRRVRAALQSGDERELKVILRRLSASLPGPTGTSVVPEWLDEFLSESPVYFVSAQRLVGREDRVRRDERVRREYETERDVPYRARVLEVSADLSGRLGAALSRHSLRSASLDRNFPSRVLAATESSLAEDSDIRERYKRLSVKRRRLSEVSLERDQEEIPLPEASLEEWQRRLLSVYLEDAEEKLEVFDGLLERVEALLEIVNSKFQYKEIFIDPERGVVVRDERGNEISAEHLSSGEQHELILTYELLFGLDGGGLVLVDEPEISLHVRWQQRFLSDLEKISGINGLRFVVATHSPQVVGSWLDRTVALPVSSEYVGSDRVW